MEKEESQRQRILFAAYALFTKQGVKTITMDDIAKELSMSKKTIYLHFKDKDDVVRQLIRRMLEDRECTMNEVVSSALDPIHEFFLMLDQIEKMLAPINPLLFYDLQKYHPEAWVLFDHFQQEYIYNMIHSNLEQGIDQGLYRPDMNLELLTHMRLLQITDAFDPKRYPSSRFNLSEVLYQLTKHFLYGLLTETGLRLLNNYLPSIDKHD